MKNVKGNMPNQVKLMKVCIIKGIIFQPDVNLAWIHKNGSISAERAEFVGSRRPPSRAGRAARIRSKSVLSDDSATVARWVTVVIC